MDNRVAYIGGPLDDKIEGIVELPVLKIVYVDVSDLKRIEDTLVLTSKRGVVSLKMSNVAIKSQRIYCIGERTSEYVRKLYSLGCEFPDNQTSIGLGDLLISREKKVRIVGSDQVSQNLVRKLRSNGIEVDETVAYRIEENNDVDYTPLEKVQKILIGSSKSFEILVKNARSLIEGKEMYAIGKPTFETMKSMKFKPAGYFKTPNISHILSKIVSER